MSHPAAAATTPAAAWRALAEGNHRFVLGRPEHPNQDVRRREETARGQAPFAVVFGCMDSRVAAEIVFDRGLGDLAVVRTAGHVVDSGVLGSLEFGVAVLGIPLVVVLGHDGCGAIEASVKAHLDGEMPDGFVRDIVERVTSSLITARPPGHSLADVDPDVLTEEHVRHTVHLLVERSRILADAVEAGACAIAGVCYQLDEGRARLIDVLGRLE